MILPCRHEERVTQQVQPTVDLLANMDVLHPDVLLQHAIQPNDYRSGLVFRSAIESIRGSFIASSVTGREGMVKDVLENLLQRACIADYSQSSGAGRYDFAIALEREPDVFAAIEVKGGEENSVNISDRSLWAKEFGVWCHLDGAIVNQPAHGAHSIVNRLTNELVRRHKLVDVLFFKDILCGTTTRPCPKYAHGGASIGLHAAPDVFLFPRRIPSIDGPEPPIHTLDDLKLPGLILDLFEVPKAESESPCLLMGDSEEWFKSGTRERRLTRAPLDPGDSGGIAVSGEAKEARQLYLFEIETATRLDAQLWHDSFNSRESTLQQLSPYVGKMKSGMARALVNLYSRPGDTVLDPFAGSGVVPLEAALAGRRAWANDLSPYAYVLTRGKFERIALQRTKALLEAVRQEAHLVDVESLPEWVREFFHPDTLREVVAAFRVLRQQKDYFLTACLLGILHHVRPGFLSYPASHLVPYLRKSKYPPDKFPEMYAYRDWSSRLLAKVKRAYRRHRLPATWEQRQYQIWQANAMNLPVEDDTADAIISSPPYFGALDYARDNRLRLWFLGCEDWRELEASLTANSRVYLPQMAVCLQEMTRVLRVNGHCVLVLGDVERDGETRRTAEILADLAVEATQGQLVTDTIYDDHIPDERRSRRRTRTTKFERILVMHKV